jgi:hypothetical protein
MSWGLLTKDGILYEMEGECYASKLTLKKTADGDLQIPPQKFAVIFDVNGTAAIPKPAEVKAKPQKSPEEIYLETLQANSNLTAPIRKPSEFGFKSGDTYVLVDADKAVAKAFDFEGNQVFAIPCTATGQNPQWRNNSGDTPPGLYKIGEIYNDYARVGANPEYDRTLMSYGWITFDLVDLEGNEDNNARAGICWHGGGSGCGWPGAWASGQELLPTLGCLRSHNVHLLEKILPRTKLGTVFVAVYQDNA